MYLSDENFKKIVENRELIERNINSNPLELALKGVDAVVCTQIKLLNKCYRTWVYTYESKKPRPSHLQSNGLRENANGYFIIDGIKTLGPGLFHIASQDINCRCDTDVFVGPTL